MPQDKSLSSNPSLDDAHQSVTEELQATSDEVQELIETAMPPLPQMLILLVVACGLGLIANWVATGINPVQALSGMVLLYGFSALGLVVARIMPFYLPSIAWISFFAILATLPFFPGHQWILSQVEALNFMALATPALAFGGFALSQNEFAIARRSGWKLVIVAVCVMIGTFIGSAIIAHLVLTWF